ncbi:MAG: exo-alpha-sialidase [Acidobacteria bacterium]|nr:exo-alpha-sialidase [Acidobacteriota bacterium]
MKSRVIGVAGSLAIMAVSLVVGNGFSLGAAPPQEIRLQSLASPAMANSGEPQLTVSSRGVLMSWVEREGPTALLKFAERTSTGWTPTRTAASGDNWFVNWADVPSVMRMANGTLAAHWLQKSGSSTYAYDVRLAQSKDDGKTWSSSFLPHHDGTQTEHGFASLFQMPEAGLGLVWLDGRAMAEKGGAMSVRYAAFDDKGKQVADAPVDLRVCECCPTTAAVTADGVIAAFRNRTEDEIRDIYVSRLDGGTWTEPKAVHNDGWKISGCPVNGPALSARGRDVVIAWFTGVVAPGQVFVAFSKDAGRTFGDPIRVDDEASLGRVDVELMPDGSALATWMEQGSGSSAFRVRRIQPAGTRGAATTVAEVSSARTSGYPRVARAGDELVFAWTEVVAAKPGARAETRVVTSIGR